MINNERIENDIRISNEFNNYFISVGSTLASKINGNSCNPLDYIQRNVQSMAIPNYYENDVTLAINYLKNSSTGWDNIPTLIAKHVIHCYIKPLVFLINQSLFQKIKIFIKNYNIIVYYNIIYIYTTKLINNSEYNNYNIACGSLKHRTCGYG